MIIARKKSGDAVSLITLFATDLNARDLPPAEKRMQGDILINFFLSPQLSENIF